MVEKFTGKKFRPTGEVKITYSIYGEKIAKEVFMPTSSYMRFLHEQEALKQKKELEHLKASLEFQYAKYGEVDPIDLDRFVEMVKRLG